ncbi:MAG: anaerobic sulfatase maturase [Armatimonadota bacterium]
MTENSQVFVPARRFHVMVKPIGPVCNLNCTYCFYLGKKDLLGHDGQQRMSDEVLESFIRQFIEGQDHPTLSVTWQGGEPTLLGLNFFRKVVALEKKYCPPGKQIENVLQTNGTLIDDEWCRFLHDNNFLVGLSIDGPPHLHDQYRTDKHGMPTSERVLRAAERFHKHKVEYNTLTVINRINAKHPLDVYKFLRDDVGSEWIQFIPCVEPKDFASASPQSWDKRIMPLMGEPAARPGTLGSVVTDWSVDPEDYGNFLSSVFDEWLHNDVGSVFVVNQFDPALRLWLGLPPMVCAFSPLCGTALALEHDGTAYPCDHYVYPDHILGNIAKTSLSQMVHSWRQVGFGKSKYLSLPDYCKRCEVAFACNGECPKNRFIRTPDGQTGLNYLCAGFRRYFNHIAPWMQLMADEIRSGGTADKVMKMARSRSGFKTKR